MMAAVPVIEVVENDELYDINFTVKDDAGVIIDLTGATIKLKVSAIGGTALELDGTCTLVVAASGTCKYEVQNGELDTVAIYHAALRVTASGGKIITTKRFDINVVKALP